VFRIYYHLYLGPSWQDVWALHRPLLERIAASGLVSRLVICVYGASGGDLGMAAAGNVEIRCIFNSIDKVNEFHTLQQLQRDAGDPAIQQNRIHLHSEFCVAFKSWRRRREVETKG